MKHFKRILFSVVCWLPLWGMAQSGRDLQKGWETKLRGDFILIGNTVVRNADEKEEEVGNAHQISKYVDIDNDNTTKNSSSATLVLRDDNGNDIGAEQCTKIKYARLYWYGRVDECWNVNGEKEKRKTIKIKHDNGTYQDYTIPANQLYEMNDSNREIYSAYVDVTDFVKSKGAGKYTVANVETMSSQDNGGGRRPTFPIRGTFYRYRTNRQDNIYSSYNSGSLHDYLGTYNDLSKYITGIENVISRASWGTLSYYSYNGNQAPDFYKTLPYSCQHMGRRSDSLGHFGGWTLVVVYENEIMSPKAVTIFDGLDKVVVQQGQRFGSKDITVTGFSTPKTGEVDGKLGLTVIEGDYDIKGDFMIVSKDPITNVTTTRVRRPGSDFRNAFDGNIIRNNSDPREPSLEVNYGTDIDILSKSQLPQGVIVNGQDTFYMRFGTTQDSYYPNLFVTSFTDYIPDPAGVGSYAGGAVTLNPGDRADFRIDFYNMGNEEILDGKVYLPIPKNVDFKLVSFTATAGTAKKVWGNIPPSAGRPEVAVPNGYIVWEVGRELPVVSDRINPKPLASLTYTIQISRDCDRLRTLCDGAPVTVEISGFVRGQGKYSGRYLPDVSLINKVETSTNKCRNLPVPDKDNSVVITRATGGTDCDYGANKQPIKFCINETYPNGIPSGNLTYNDNLNAGEYIDYEWKTYKVLKTKVQKDTKGRVIGLGTPAPSLVQVISGKTGDKWTTKQRDAKNFGDGIMYNQVGGVTLQMPSYDPNTEEIYLEVKSTKKNASGAIIIGCSKTDYIPLVLLRVPNQNLTLSLTPGTPLCAFEGKITFTSPNNQSIIEEQDPNTGLVISGVTYSVLYKRYKKNATQTEKDLAPILKADLNGEGKSVVELKDLQEGEYTYETIGITNGTCTTAVSKKQNVSVKKQAPSSTLTSDGKIFTITPSAENNVVVSYKLQRKVVTIDNNKITKEEWKDIKKSGASYIYETQEIAINKLTEVTIPRLQGEYRVLVTTRYTAGPNVDSCIREQTDIITVDKNLRFYYINPNLRNRASTN